VEVNPDSSLRYMAIELRTNKVLLQVNALVDTGATDSFINRQVWEKLTACDNELTLEDTATHLSIPLNSSGSCNRILQEINVHANGLPTLQPPIYVIDDKQPMIVGLRAIENWN